MPDLVWRPDAVLTGTDRRSRPSNTLDALRAPKALPARLSIAPQTTTALLRDWQGRGVAREVTGRGRFGTQCQVARWLLPERRQCRVVSR
jgi:hypothetical protein